MKLQYLGDSRDAFKWDLLHWICTTSPFSNLVFVPLLTADIEGSGEGLTSTDRFKCQELIRPFLTSLKQEPRSLNRISALGTLHAEKQFSVSIFAPDRVIGSGLSRQKYWKDFDASALENSIVFYDPDNGYETRTQSGPKWIEHAELKTLFACLPETSVALVYQHRPRRTWADLFADLSERLAYVPAACAVHESTLAFVAMAGNAKAGIQIAATMKEYAGTHPTVEFVPLI